MSHAASNTLVHTVEPSRNPSSSVTKQEKRRWKKLRKRLTSTESHGERSGVLTALEWLECQQLSQQCEGNSISRTIGPSVNLRKGKEGVNVDVAQQRDLLAWLLKQLKYPNPQGAQTSKKRSRNETEEMLHNPSIPSWASIHNPGALSNVTILEIHVPPGALDSVSTLIARTAQDHGSRRKLLKMSTRLFQGYRPRSISDGLLYYTVNNKAPYSNSTPDSFPSKTQLMQQLETFILPTDKWYQESFPIATEEQVYSDSNASENDHAWLSEKDLISTEVIPLKRAQSMVQSMGFRVAGQSDEDKQIYIMTRSGDPTIEVQDESRVFGLDCEMVRTRVGSELVRLTLVRFDGLQTDSMQSKCILDVLVKPYNSVQDYLTKYSGMTSELLDPVSTRLEQVQVLLRDFIRPKDILIGHSLENDLHAAHYIHPRIIDTALLFRPRNKRVKYSLKHLAAALLKKRIQSGPHCSEEDAATSLELAIRRAQLGDSFAAVGGDERISLLEAIPSELKAACIGPHDWIQTHIVSHATGIHAIAYDGIRDVGKAMLSWLKGKRMAQILLSKMVVEEDNAHMQSSLDEALSQILSQAPRTTMFLISVQQGLQHANDFHRKKRARQDPRSSIPWTAADEASWKAAIDSTRSGLVFWVGSTVYIPRDGAESQL